MKNIVIFGGTGSLGKALCSQIEADPEPYNVWIVSRCELRQKELRQKFPAKYVLGDIRGNEWLDKLPKKADYVFNLAASKHIEVCEDNVEYCADVNYHGTINTYKYARVSGAKYIFTTTDKAVRPVNAYGMAKAMSERYLRDKDDALVFLWGNVMGSRGSVLHIFKDKLLAGEKIPITHKDMTRFWLHLDDAAEFLWRSRDSSSKRRLVPALGSSSILALLEVVADHLGVSSYEIDIVGIRPGEKIHEEIGWSVDVKDDKYTSQHFHKFEREDLVKLVGRVLG